MIEVALDGGRWRSLASLGFKPGAGLSRAMFEAVGGCGEWESAQWKLDLVLRAVEFEEVTEVILGLTGRTWRKGRVVPGRRDFQRKGRGKVWRRGSAG